jgi:hypothetical protein
LVITQQRQPSQLFGKVIIEQGKHGSSQGRVQGIIVDVEDEVFHLGHQGEDRTDHIQPLDLQCLGTLGTLVQSSITPWWQMVTPPRSDPTTCNREANM